MRPPSSAMWRGLFSPLRGLDTEEMHSLEVIEGLNIFVARHIQAAIRDLTVDNLMWARVHLDSAMEQTHAIQHEINKLDTMRSGKAV